MTELSGPTHAGTSGTPLTSLLAYVERESARRAKGAHPGMTRLHDDELAVLLALLRREIGTAPIAEAVR